MRNNPLDELFREFMMGHGPEPEYHRATLSSTEIDGERIVRDGIEPGHEYIVDMATKADAVRVNKETRSAQLMEAVETVHPDDGYREIFPLQLLTVGEEVRQIRCVICGDTVFMSLQQAFDASHRRVPLPGSKDGDSVCDSCWPVVEPISGHGVLMQIQASYNEHMEKCGACQNYPSVPCLQMQEILLPGDNVVTAGGVPLGVVLKKVAGIRSDHALQRSLRQLRQMQGVRRPTGRSIF